MPAIPQSRTRLAGALLLALALPLSAQSPEPESPVEDATVEATVEDPGLEVAAESAGPTPQTDPALLDAEIMPRANRSLLLDVVRTTSGFFAVGERGHVLVSEDGQSWTQAKVPTRATLTTIATADGVLWAAGHDGVIVHSTDGGQTWTRRRAAPWSYDIVDSSEGIPVLDLLFTDGSNGLAVGAYSLMLATSDGGVTWTPRRVSSAAPAAEAEAESSEELADEDDWNFSDADLELEAESDPHFNAIARAGSGALVIAGERGAFLRSRDGGKTWTSKPLPYEGSMFGVLSWQDEHILVYGLRGNVFESFDLGTTWTEVETGITDNLMGGQALPGGGALIVGANGAVLYRPDGGTPFRSSAFETAGGETPVLASAVALNDGSFVLVGDKGVDTYRPE